MQLSSFVVAMSQLLECNRIVGTYDGFTLFADIMMPIDVINRRIKESM